MACVDSIRVSGTPSPYGARSVEETLALFAETSRRAKAKALKTPRKISCGACLGTGAMKADGRGDRVPCGYRDPEATECGGCDGAGEIVLKGGR